MAQHEATLLALSRRDGNILRDREASAESNCEALAHCPALRQTGFGGAPAETPCRG